jgi:glycosyltransferase involved in cell wall biosynthesis
VFRPEDPADLARVIEQYFEGDLFADLNNRRKEIQEFAAKRHSWDEVNQITVNVYADLLGIPKTSESLDFDASNA